jgi:hypothetical protein
MIAVKERIEIVKTEIETYKAEHGITNTELLPETYFRLKYRDEKEATQQTEVEIKQSHLE